MRLEALIEIERLVRVWESVEKTIPKTISRLKSKDIPIYHQLIPIYEARRSLLRDLLASAESLSDMLHNSASRASLSPGSDSLDVGGGIISIKSFLKHTQIFTFFLASLIAGAALFLGKITKTKQAILTKELKAKLITHTRYFENAAPEDPTFAEYVGILHALIENIEAEEVIIKNLSLNNIYKA